MSRDPQDVRDAAGPRPDPVSRATLRRAIRLVLALVVLDGAYVVLAGAPRDGLAVVVGIVLVGLAVSLGLVLAGFEALDRV